MEQKTIRLIINMIKFKKVPSIPEDASMGDLWKAKGELFHFLKFVLVTQSRNRKSDADRMTFAAVLEIIAENSPATLAMCS